MISFKNVKIIFKKEFLQAMRDKSVLFTNFFIPLFGLPLYLIFVIEAANYAAKKAEKPLKDDTVFNISYQGDLSTELFHHLQSDKKINLVKIKSSLSEDNINDYRKKFRNYIQIKEKRGKIKKRIKQETEERQKYNLEYLNAKKDSDEALNLIKNSFNEGSDLHMALFKNEKNILASYFFYGGKNNKSKAAHKYLMDKFNEFEKDVVQNYRNEMGIKSYHLDPIHIWELNLNRDNEKIIKAIGVGIGGGILFLLLISVFNPAINTTLVERDQNTYKFLLMNPVSLHEIFLGKYLNVAFQGLLALIPYFIEFLVIYAWGASTYLFESMPSFNFLKFVLLTTGTLTAAIFISSLCFIACSFAKTRVQAQSLLTLLIFFLVIPIATVGMMDIKLNHLTAFIPLVSFPLTTENLMLTNPNYTAVMFSIVSNTFYSLFLIWLSLGAFLVQWKGKSDTKSLSDLLTFKRRKSDVLVPAHAFMAFALAFLGYTYGGFVVASFKIEFLSYLFTPILFCLGTTIFITQYSGMDFTKVIDWKGLDFSYFLKLILSAFCLNYLLSLLILNSDIVEIFNFQFPQIFKNDEFISYAGVFLLFALIPGFMEELLFRGIIYKGLKAQYNFKISMILSAIFFAIIHFSMFRFGHSFLMGLVFAYIYEKRGLFSCIIMHILFNSFGLLFAINETFNTHITSVSNIQLIMIVPPFLACSFAFLTLSARNGKTSNAADSST